MRNGLLQIPDGGRRNATWVRNECPPASSNSDLPLGLSIRHEGDPTDSPVLALFDDRLAGDAKRQMVYLWMAKR